jgi:hypothetical protein
VVELKKIKKNLDQDIRSRDRDVNLKLPSTKQVYEPLDSKVRSQIW